MNSSSTTSTNSSCTIYNNREFVIAAEVNGALAVVSVLACLLGLGIIILFKKWRFFTQRLVLYLIISATVLSVSIVFHRVDYGGSFNHSEKIFCMFTGYLSETTVWMLINAITAITIYLFLRVGWDKCTAKYEILYVLFIFASPLTWSWIPFIHQAYGRAGVWCWIRSIDLITCDPFQFGMALQLAMFYVPVFLLMPTLLCLYLIVLCKLYRKKRKWQVDASEHTERLMRRQIISLLAYPVIYLVDFLPQIINRIQSWIAPSQPSIVLWYLSGIAFPLLGPIIVLAFTLDADTRRRLNWAHLSAAVRNYHSKKKVVSEYATGEVEVSENSEKHHAVSYKQLTDEAEVENIDSV